MTRIRYSAHMQEIEEKLARIQTLYPIKFTTDQRLYDLYWNVRNGLFTSAAASRPPHTASIIEDIAFNGDILGDALTDVRELLVRTGYSDAVMVGAFARRECSFYRFPRYKQSGGREQIRPFYA